MLKTKKRFDNVSCFGYLKNRYVLSILKQVDFALMPYQDNLKMGKHNINSLSWMSPLKMFDYMNSKNAIISSYFPVLEEVLTNYHTGYFIYDYSNPKAWAETLRSEITNKDKRFKKIGNNAKVLFETKYSYKIRSNQIFDFF